MVLREKPQIKFLYYLEGGGHDRFSTLAHHSSWPQTRQLAQEPGGGGIAFFFPPEFITTWTKSKVYRIEA